MGKKRIKVMGEEETPKKKERKIVKTGKQHGRITDMGAIAVEEAKKIKEKEKELEKSATKKVKSEKREKPSRQRSKKYLAAKKQVDRTKAYPLSEAVKLVKKTSLSRFSGRVELHLVTKEKGAKSKDKGSTRKVHLPHPLGKQAELKISPEKKTPLIHLVIGNADSQESQLTENFQAVVGAIGVKNIRKAVLAATMGPGIKVDLNSI